MAPPRRVPDVRALHANLIEHYRLHARLSASEFHRGAGRGLVPVGTTREFPQCGDVRELRPRDAGRRVDEVLAPFQERGVPMRWWTDERGRPGDLNGEPRASWAGAGLGRAGDDGRPRGPPASGSGPRDGRSPGGDAGRPPCVVRRVRRGFRVRSGRRATMAPCVRRTRHRGTGSVAALHSVRRRGTGRDRHGAHRGGSGGRVPRGDASRIGAGGGTATRSRWCR